MEGMLATIPAKHGEPDAKEPNPVIRSTLIVDRKKKGSSRIIVK